MWKKIVAPVAFVALLWVVGGGFTTYYIMWLQSSFTEVLRESTVSVRLAGEMESTVWRLQTAVLDSTQKGWHGFPTDAAEAELAFERSFDAMNTRARTADEKQLISEIGVQFSRYREAAHAALDSAASDPVPLATLEATSHLATVVASTCKRYVMLNQTNLMASINRIARLTRGVNALRFIMFVSGPVIGVLLGIWVSHVLRSSIQRLSIRLQDATQGVEKDLGLIEVSPTAELPMLEKQVQEVSLRLSQAANEIERSRRDAERSERLAAAGELAAGIAHELRNPLTSVKLLVQSAARKQREQPLTAKQFQILQEEIARMEASIQSLMDLARPPKVRRRLHNVCDTLRRSLNLMRSRAAQNGVELLAALPSDRIMMQGDAEQLHQVFVNLLLNALHAMPGGGTLRVSFGGKDGEHARCRIKFADTGPGVPDEMLDRIFEPFVSGRESGYGLGLAVSRRIVMEHNGTITASNRPEGGALFVVALPFVSVEPDTQPPASDSDVELPVLGSATTVVLGSEAK